MTAPPLPPMWTNAQYNALGTWDVLDVATIDPTWVRVGQARSSNHANIALAGLPFVIATTFLHGVEAYVPPWVATAFDVLLDRRNRWRREHDMTFLWWAAANPGTLVEVYELGGPDAVMDLFLSEVDLSLYLSAAAARAGVFSLVYNGKAKTPRPR